MEPLPQSALAPEREVLMAEPPGGQVMGHQRPSTAGSVDVEDAIENFAIGIDTRSSIAFVGPIHLDKEGFKESPLAIGHVCSIGLSVH